MGLFQDALDKQIVNLPRLAARDLVRAKLADLGIDDDHIIDRITDAILAAVDVGGDDIVRFKLDWPEGIEISIDDADVERLVGKIDKFVDGLPDVIVRLLEKTSSDIAAGLRKQWDDTRPEEDAAGKTRARVAKDWGAALDDLRMLVALCAQEGEAFNLRHMKSQIRALRDEARARLHIRACRIAEEILLLLENGLTEGAQARWRTLHEVAVVAGLIKEGGDDLAERFFDHDAVERKRMLDDYRRAAVAAGAKEPEAAEARNIERAFNRAVTKYGKHFQGMYGWASAQLGLPKEPKFHDLQERIGSLSLKHRFRVASSGNHVSVTTLGQPVHYWDPTTIIPGAFAAGFDGPAIDTAQAIVQATTALYDEPWDLDQLVFVGTLGVLRNETAESWRRAARSIETREQRTIDQALRFGRERRMGYVKSRPVGGWR